jgi:predicted nucleotidyltransferase
MTRIACPWEAASVRAMSRCGLALGRLVGALSVGDDAAMFAAMCARVDRAHRCGSGDIDMFDRVSRSVSVDEFRHGVHGDGAGHTPDLVGVALRWGREVRRKGLDGTDLAAMLVADGVLHVPALCTGAWLSRRNRAIGRAIATFDQPAGQQPWLRLVFDGLGGAADDAFERVGQVRRMRHQHHQLVTAELMGRYPAALLDLLTEQPLVNTGAVVDRLGASPTTAGHLLGAFGRLGLVDETTGRKRDRLYRYTPLVRLFASAIEVTSPRAIDGRWHNEPMSSTLPPRSANVGSDERTLDEWVPVIVNRLFERSAAERIILFGSVARGEADGDSDIDLIVVLPIKGRKHEAGVRLMAELRDLPVPVDVVIVDSAEYPSEARLPGIVRVAVREGRIFERAA